MQAAHGDDYRLARRITGAAPVASGNLNTPLSPRPAHDLSQAAGASRYRPQPTYRTGHLSRCASEKLRAAEDVRW
jgi:hypothetical protein